jgi:hypothetical protein
MMQLINDALAHAKRLRQSANAADDCGARVIEADAERRERLATDARLEVNSTRCAVPRR